MSRRLWTEEETEYLRAHYGRNRWKAIGRKLGRTPSAIAQKASLLGLKQIAWKKGEPPAELLAFIREQHAAGALDSDMARQWNAEHPGQQVQRRSLCYLRHTMGLLKNKESLRERRREGQRKQLEVLGVSRFQDLGRRFRRRRAASAGWPEGTTPLEMRILDVMLDGELRDRTELAEAIGHDHLQQRHFFKTRTGAQSALANLVRKGLLRRTAKRMRRGVGKGRSRFLYWMPMDVIRDRKRKTA